ncbi:uncharacterized protein LOC108676917 [Hyalella azteca]|uniref:Uncharacterized protein LOC108676917 n=1 Tax=Hyalella azteca TaxID=294128 RepID=A0A8B7P372_HYAAZ|nr:uncharacterized protein LOC108676917 [Hyalella azteca]
MMTYADDYSLRKLLECYGVTLDGASALRAGQFDGIFQLQMPDAARLYIVAVPVTRLTPEVAVQRVVYARAGGARVVVVQPAAEYSGSAFRWDSVDVVSTDDSVTHKNITRIKNN